MFLSVLRLLCLCARLFICALSLHPYLLCGHLLGKGSFVVSNCELVTFPLVSWVMLRARRN